MSIISKSMAQFDHLFKQEEKKPAAPAAPPVADPASVQQEPEGPMPAKPLDIKDGKGNYQAIVAPRYERREWFYIYPRAISPTLTHPLGMPEMLRFDLVMRIPFSPDGSQFMIIYSDQVYWIKGRNLLRAVDFIADRYLLLLAEFDPSVHRTVIGDDPIITSMEAYQRSSPVVKDWLDSQRGNQAP